jgi:hypothetical protein
MAKVAKENKKNVGIPRTLRAAKKLGHKKAKIKFNDLSPQLKSNFVQLDDRGARTGAFCGVGPSTDPSYWLVCYKDASGKCNWVHVPRTAIQKHD